MDTAKNGEFSQDLMAKAHKKPLKNSLRLKKRSDFLRLQHIGVRQVMAHFILQAGKAPDPISGSRFGFTASKKIGNAVCRNRAKRRLRALSHALDAPALRAGTDYVLIARQSVLGAEFASLAADLQKAMRAVHKKLDNPLPPKKYGHKQQN